MNFYEVLHIVSDIYFVVTMTTCLICEIISGFIDGFREKNSKEESNEQNEAQDQDNEAFVSIISHNSALGFVDTLEGSFGADPIYFDSEYAGAIEGLRFYIAQEQKKDADR